jgi:hypothetical protein
VATLEGHKEGVSSVAFHPTAPILATGSSDNTTKLWRLFPDLNSANCVATLEGHTASVSSVAFHPTAPILATGSWDNTIKVWLFSPDISAANCIATLTGHTNHVLSVNFHPMKDILVTGSKDFTAKLWKLELTLSVINSNFHNRNNQNLIIIPSELLKSKSNSFPDFTDLYNYIMTIKLPQNLRFEIKGQVGLNYAELIKDIFKKLLAVYTFRFFEKNNGFWILKNIENMPSMENLDKETKQMIALAKATGEKIFLNINPILLLLLQSDDYRQYFNSKKNLENLYHSVNNAINKSNNRLFLGNNSGKIIKQLKETQNNTEINKLKREIRLRRFAIQCGFIKWEQLDNMFIFIQKFYNPKNPENYDLFTSNLQSNKYNSINELLIGNGTHV